MEKINPNNFIAFSIWYGYYTCTPRKIPGGLYEHPREHFISLGLNSPPGSCVMFVREKLFEMENGA